MTSLKRTNRPVAIRWPTEPSPASTSALNGSAPVRHASSRLATTSIVTFEPFRATHRWCTAPAATTLPATTHGWSSPRAVDQERHRRRGREGRGAQDVEPPGRPVQGAGVEHPACGGEADRDVAGAGEPGAWDHGPQR